MDVIVEPLLEVILLVLGLLKFIVFVWVVMSWLVTFNVLNTRNRFVYVVWDSLNRFFDPILRPIRNALPSTGGLDLSPLVLLLAIFFLERVIIRLL